MKKKWEEKADVLSGYAFKSKVLLTGITENYHKKGGHNLRRNGIPAQGFYKQL